MRLNSKIITALVLVCTGGLAHAQDANVLIGLNGPAYGIKIKNNLPGTGGFARAFTLSNQDASVDFIGLGARGQIVNGITSMDYGYIGPSYNKSFMAFTPAGNVGIDNTDPVEKLDVKGNVFLRNMTNVSGAGASILFSSYSNNSPGARIRNYLDFASGPQSRSRLVLSSYNSGYMDELTLMEGNVGIGTATPKEKLSVNGNIRAKEIKVEAANWPDYVFTKDYSVPSLEETEKHIKESGHLPGIPSAAEVKSNGIGLGEMNAKLLEKIEQLTLQVIELNKTVKKLHLYGKKRLKTF